MYSFSQEMRRIRKVPLAGWILLVSAAGVCALIWVASHPNDDVAKTKPLRQHRLLCFVPADSKRVSSSLSVKETWGSRCDALLFFRSVVFDCYYPREIYTAPSECCGFCQHLSQMSGNRKLESCGRILFSLFVFS